MIGDALLTSCLHGRAVLMVTSDVLLADLLEHYLSTDYSCTVRKVLLSELDHVSEDKDPDIILVEINVYTEGSSDLLSKMRRRFPVSRIAILSGFQNSDIMEDCMEYGVSAFLLRNYTLDRMCVILSVVVSGETYFPMEMLEPQARASKKVKRALTVRERSVVTQLSYGRSNQEIARELGMKLSTVKMHVSSALRKANLQNRSQLAIFVRGGDLITLSGDETETFSPSLARGFENDLFK